MTPVPAAPRRILLLALAALVAVPADAQWAFGFGGPDRDQADAVALDADGGVFLTGTFQGTADFDPGTGTAALTSAGGQDVFLAHYDADGALDWAARLGGPNWETAMDLAVDPSGNVYVVGAFEGTADFDPGDGTFELTGSGFEEAFVASYTPGGALRWAFAFGGGDYDQAFAVTATAEGIYVTGAFEGTADFDPGAAAFELTGSEFGDVFVARYTLDGAFGWAFDVGISAHDDGAAIAADAEGNLFVTGSFSGTPVDFDPGPGVAFPDYGGTNDYFVASYAPDGAFRWVVGAGGESFDGGEAVAVDAAGNVYTAGFFNGAADFDPGPGTVLLSAAGPQDAFVASYANDGAFRWAFPVGGGAWDNAHGLAAVEGSLLLTGSFGETVDFDPGAGAFTLTALALDDIYVAHYTTGGAFVDAFNVGGGLGNFGLDVAAVAGGEAWVAGAFEGTPDFDPGSGALVLTAQDRDGFLARYPMEFAVGTEPGAAPVTGALSAAYPNPARTSVHFTLTLEAPEVVEVAVFDALGRRVATLHAGALPAGPTALALGASALPAGTYVVRAVGETFTATRRVTVAR